MCRIAMISVHGSPLAQPGARETGGMNVYVRELSRELGRRGMVVDVFTRRTDHESPDVEYIADHVRLIRLKAGTVGPMDKVVVFDHLSEYICRALRFADEQNVQYQYVHSHYWLSGWVGNHLARRWSLPHAVMFHTLALVKNDAMPENVESPRRIEVERRVIATADAIIAATAHERDAMIEHYDAPRGRIRVIPCGVDLDHFSPRNRYYARQTLDLAQDDEVVLFVGRFDPLKGLEVLLRAVALLANRPHLRLLVAGGSPDDPELPRLRQLTQTLGIAERVRFLGAVPQACLPLHYSAADVCVMPSAYESFGLVAVESLACGTPVVATNVGGLATVVRDGENGLLISRRDPSLLAGSLDRYFGDAALRTRLSAWARASVLRFQWGSVAERVIDLYHELGAAACPQQVCLCHR